jgi:16S rRNA G527 N7-methylase RsmG
MPPVAIAQDKLGTTTGYKETRPVHAIRDPADFAAAFAVSRETLARLVTYEALLGQWQKAKNLVGPSTLDALWHRHFADSAQLVALAPTAKTWIDLGSGAGFPGLVVAILLAEGRRSAADPGAARLDQAQLHEARLHGAQLHGAQLHGAGLHAGGGREPGARAQKASKPVLQGNGGSRPARITLIESNTRKCAFLREVVRQTHIAALVSVDILSTRIETAATQASLHAPDVVSARAVAPLDKLVALAAPLFASSTVGLFLKGRDAATELEAAEKLWTFQSELVPSRTERDARIVVVRNLERKNEGMTS